MKRKVMQVLYNVEFQSKWCGHIFKWAWKNRETLRGLSRDERKLLIDKETKAFYLYEVSKVLSEVLRS